MALDRVLRSNSIRELELLLARRNDLTRSPFDSASIRDETETLDHAIETIFGTSRRLAVYGSLAPGESNHRIVADLQGEWFDGVVRGHLVDSGWASGLGYPALRWDPNGDDVPAKLFVSADLPDHWDRLDAFEGDHYQRDLVTVHHPGRETSVANIYVAREAK
ncbi:MAG: gamma-glutamylcyclotransferase [Gemmatimonadetes bacterium]|nr:gamma-glutamylcyclotransferase [Gemmatimonadota bacterium]